MGVQFHFLKYWWLIISAYVTVVLSFCHDWWCHFCHKIKYSCSNFGSRDDTCNNSCNAFIVVVPLLRCVWLFCDPMDRSTPHFPVLHHLLEFAQTMSIESVMPSNHLILCRPLLLLPLICPSIRDFTSELALRIRWAEYWSFSFSISLSSEYSVLISFWIDWFDLFAVQGTPKSLLQHLSLKASILWHSAFFIVQLSHSYWKKHSFD